MQNKQKNGQLNIAAENYEFSLHCNSGAVVLKTKPCGELTFPVIPALPIRADIPEDWRVELDNIFELNDCTEIVVALRRSNVTASVASCHIRLASSYISFKTSCCAEQEYLLGGWHVFPPGTEHNFPIVDNLWNCPETADNVRSYDSSKDVDTTTGGANRIWAPHVPALILRTNETAVLFGVNELSHAFGLNYHSYFDNGRITSAAFLDYGSREYGMRVNAGEKNDSPTIVLQFYNGTSSEDIYADYFQKYCRRNDGTKPELSQEWRKPWYCTWSDQYSFSMSRKLGHHGCLDALNEKLVMDAVAKIRKHQLPVGTIIIDDGWQTCRGDWDVDPNKFPDFRRLTDKLHEAGFKAMLWWAPFCYDESSRINRYDWMFCEGKDAYNRRMLDYSSFRVQKEYLNPLLDRIFSPRKDGWNFDGVKIDFLADRNHPTAQAEDRQWHGQEYYLLNLYRLVWEAVNRHKNNFCIYGTAQHPEFEPYQTILGFEETYTPEPIHITSRCALQKKLMPQTPVTAHFSYFCGAMEEFMHQSIVGGAIPQIPPLFQDLSGALPDEDYFVRLKIRLEQYQKLCNP